MTGIADALPPLDVTPAPAPSDCADAGATLIYVLTTTGALLSFDPPAATFSPIGTIACSAASTPNSMAVDHTGLAYVGFHDGTIFRVSTRSAACQATSFVASASGFASSFGMGFAATATRWRDALHHRKNTFNPRLASVDTTTFALHVVGFFNPPLQSPELTGSGAGGLFAFAAAGVDSTISQVDEATANIIGQTTLRGVAQGEGWAFAFWGGDFYTFTASAPTGSTVTRYRPGDGSLARVAAYPQVIVGAGVSTCTRRNSRCHRDPYAKIRIWRSISLRSLLSGMIGIDEWCVPFGSCARTDGNANRADSSVAGSWAKRRL